MFGGMGSLRVLNYVQWHRLVETRTRVGIGPEIVTGVIHYIMTPGNIRRTAESGFKPQSTPHPPPSHNALDKRLKIKMGTCGPDLPVHS
jgi:hypothetical protein